MMKFSVDSAPFVARAPSRPSSHCPLLTSCTGDNRGLGRSMRAIPTLKMTVEDDGSVSWT